MKRYSLFLLTILMTAMVAHAWNFEEVTHGNMHGFVGVANTVSWGDVDNNGVPDLFIGGSDRDASALMINTGGDFVNETRQYGLPALYNVRSAQWIDYNADGNLDLFCLIDNRTLSRREVPGIRLFKQNRNHVFEEVTFPGFDAHYYVQSALWMDANQDGFIDLVLSNSAITGMLTVLEQNSQNFVEQRGGLSEYNLANVGTMCLIDYDNDGDQDIFMGSDGESSACRLMQNDDGVYTDVARNLGLPTTLATTGAVWFDSDNDGNIDLFTLGTTGESHLFMNSIEGTQRQLIDVADKSSFHSLTANCRNATAVDANMDGRLELFLNRSDEFGCVMMVNNISGGWQNEAEEISLNNKIRDNYASAWADYDGDGDLDLAVATSRMVRIFRNDITIHHQYLYLRLVGAGVETPLLNCTVKMEFGNTDVLNSSTTKTSWTGSSSDLLVVNPRRPGTHEIFLTVNWPDGSQSTYDQSVLHNRQVNIIRQPRDENPENEDVLFSVEPGAVELANCPNPFNPTTQISFNLPAASHVELAIFNLLGQKVEMLADQEFAEGTHQFTFNASNLPSGLYFARLSALGTTQIHRMLLAK